jgi:hypothetical protein
MEVYSIGFTQKTAEQFFGILKRASIRRLLDVRLNNLSQLAGFAKRQDLPFFLKEICGAEYRHEPLLAPTQDILDTYRKRKGSWAEYESSGGSRAFLIGRCLRAQPFFSVASQPPNSAIGVSSWIDPIRVLRVE